MGALSKSQEKIAREYYKKNPDVMLDVELGIKLGKFGRLIVRKVCSNALHRKRKGK